MKVGIIVHSHTGNTLSVAQKLKEQLLAAGHSVTLEQVTAVNESPSAGGKIQLKTIPDPSSYDALIIGAPVQGFSLSPVMKVYLSQIPSLKGKKVSCFTTQLFPFAWMGGNRAIEQTKKACKTKGVNISETGIINWSRKDRDRKIRDVIEKLIRL